MESYKPGSWEAKNAEGIDIGDPERLREFQYLKIYYQGGSPLINMGIKDHLVGIETNRASFSKIIEGSADSIVDLGRIIIDNTYLSSEDSEKFIRKWGTEILGLTRREHRLNKEYSADREEAEKEQGGAEEESEERYQQKRTKFADILGD